jgi:hypothetical protein
MLIGFDPQNTSTERGIKRVKFVVVHSEKPDGGRLAAGESQTNLRLFATIPSAFEMRRDKELYPHLGGDECCLERTGISVVHETHCRKTRDTPVTRI